MKPKDYPIEVKRNFSVMKPSRDQQMPERKSNGIAFAQNGATQPIAPCGASRKQALLIDEHPMIRAGLAQLIRSQADLEVCAEAGNASEAFRRLGKQKPDLILTGLTIPG